jgi:hypothetical protein
MGNFVMNFEDAVVTRHYGNPFFNVGVAQDRLCKNLTGALQIDGARCTLSAGWDVDTRIPVDSMYASA